MNRTRRKTILWSLGLLAVGVLIAGSLGLAAAFDRQHHERCQRLEVERRICMRTCAAEFVARRRAFFGGHYVCSHQRWAACVGPCCPDEKTRASCKIDCGYCANMNSSGGLAGG
jgi:hypothetical protein